MSHSVSSKALFGIGVAMTVAAISSIFIVMVAGQSQESSDGAAPQQSQNGNGNQTSTAGATTTITIPQGAAAQTVEQFYEPDPAQVASGSEVTWENQDSQPHTATADDGSFDTGNIAAGESGSATIQGEGEIAYHCTIHPFMTGTLQVRGGEASQQQNQSQQGNQTAQQPSNETQSAAGNKSASNATTIAILEGSSSHDAQQFYEPDPAQVKSGSEVTWQNQDSVAHTATARDGSFDTGNIAPGQSGSATVQGQGTIDYYCTIHPHMTGTLQISGGQQEGQNQTQTAQADQVAVSDAVHQLQELSPNELAQALEQLSQNYQEAANALGGDLGQENETSVADTANHRQEANQTSATESPANVTQSGVEQNATRQNATLIGEAREAVESLIERLDEVAPQ